MAAKLYEVRDRMKRILRDDYGKTLSPIKAGLRDRAEKTGKSVLLVGQEGAAAAVKRGYPKAALLYLAAAVECVEADESVKSDAT